MPDNVPAPAPQGAPPPVDAAQAPSAAPSLTDGFTGIPEKFSSDPDFQGFGSLDDVLGEFKQLKGLHANREKNGLLEVPGEGATPEQQAAFWEKLGRPKSAAEYGFKAPEDLPQGLDYSDERAAWFAETALKHNLTTSQAQGLFADWHAQIGQEFTAALAASEEAAGQVIDQNLAALEQKWGKPDSPTFEANHKNALKAFNFVADADMAAAFKENPALQSNPLVLDLLSKLGARMSPDSAPATSLVNPSGGFKDNLESLEQRVAKFHQDGKFQKMLGSDAEAAQYKKEWQELNAKRVDLMQ